MATLNFGGTARQKREAEIKVFGEELADADYADIAGDLTGDAVLNVAYDEPWMYGGGPNATIRIHAKNALASTKIRLVPGRFDFSECKVTNPQGRTRARILLKLALTARSRGFREITGRGERDIDANTGEFRSVGFYAFPRLGFDALIPPNTPVRPVVCAGCTRISHLMATDAGREFWLASGVEIPSTSFDLAENSLSWHTLTLSLESAVRRRAYELWEERSHEHGNEWAHWYDARREFGIPQDFYL